MLPSSFRALLLRIAPEGFASRWVRLALGVGMAVYFVAGMGLLALRWGVLPQVSHWRPELEQIASRSIGLPLSMAHLEADWDGLRPRLRIGGLSLKDKAGHEVLHLDHVDASLGWSSLIFGRLRLHRLVVERPLLDIRRDAKGNLHVAGLSIRGSGESRDFTQWLFDPRTLVIDEASVRWTDFKRGAEPLMLEHVDFLLENSGSHHRFGLRAEPPKALASPFDLRGDFHLKRGAPLREAQGEFYANIDYADLVRWQRWVETPFSIRHGLGGLRLWLSLARGGHVDSVAADLALRELSVRFSPKLPPLDLARLTGRLRFARSQKGWQLDGHEITLASSDGSDMNSTDFQMRRTLVRGRGQSEFEASNLDVGVLAGLAAHLPFPSVWRERLEGLEPRGHFQTLELAWDDEGRWPSAYRIDARFDGLGLAPFRLLPGGQGWSGRIQGNEKGGEYSLTVAKGKLVLPAVFEQSVIPLDEGRFSGNWVIEKGKASVRLVRAKFRNVDAQGVASGRYRSRGVGAGEIELDARIDRAQASSAWRYVPRIVSPAVASWLRASLQSGYVDGAHLRLAGNLDRFPFRDGLGEFRIAGRLHDVRLAFAPNWPPIDEIEGSLLFDRARMQIDAERGRVFGSRLGSVRAVIPDLEHGRLSVDGKATGTTAEFLRFVNASPIVDSVGYFSRGVQAKGEGALALHLDVPLDKPERTLARGQFLFEHNQLSLPLAQLELAEARGSFEFTERAFSIPEVTANLMGAPVHVHGHTRSDGAVEIAAQGSLVARAFANAWPSPLWDHLSGSSPASAALLVHGQDVDLTLASSLQGVASSLPEPLNKSGVDAWPLRVGVKWRSQGGRVTQSIGAEISGSARLLLALREEGSRMRFERGALALGEAEPALPERGLTIKVVTPRLDVDAWRRAVSGGDSSASVLPDMVDLNVGELLAEGLRLERQTLRADRDGQRWSVRLVGGSAMGDLSWDGSGTRFLRGRLTRLSLRPNPILTARSLGAIERPASSPWPSADLAVDSFALKGRELGALRLKGHPKGRDWQLDQLTVSNQDGHIDAHGESLSGASRLHFRLDAEDAGGLLARVGYPGALRRGTARAEGDLEWRGGLASIDYPSLSGGFSLQAANGQFSKIDPGVARLLGVLSLQSLPRRVSLDFRDVFSEGFAFDRIFANIKISQGVLQTQDLAIVGPAARVAMRGSADLASETQNLKVMVQPTLSETVAIGAALGPAIGVMNPLVGVAAYVAQKMLRDPVEKLFSYEYHVTGSWSDPQVRKLSSPPLRVDNAK